MEIIDKDTLIDIFEGAASHLNAAKEEVNDLNVFPVPDGDTGTNMSKTVDSALKQVQENNPQTVAEVASLASRGALMGARGNSGVILSQLFRGFAEGLEGVENASIADLAIAFNKASEMTYLAVMKPTEGTILTVGREISEYSNRVVKQHKDIIEFLEDVLEQAKISLNNTPNLLPVLKEAGVVDAGGKGLVVLLEGGLLALKGEKTIVNNQEKDIINKQERKSISTDNIKFAYCTEFIVNTESDHVEELKTDLTPLGDSLLVVGDPSMIKVHLHTNNPGNALQFGLNYGNLKDIKIDNMCIQHEEILFTKAEIANVQDEDKLSQSEELKEYGFVAVSSGAGISETFKEIGVDYVVTGGQTMNPSTEDILKGIEEAHAENVFIFPNNGNIILAAEQARDLSDVNVIVIPTQTIPEGIGACLAFNGTLSVEENQEEMLDVIDHIYTGQITYAVRDSIVSGKQIKKDSYIGIAGKEIYSCGEDRIQVGLELVDELMNDDISLISIFYNEDVKEEEAETFVEALEERYEDIDIDLIYGRQPLYYYLISLE